MSRTGLSQRWHDDPFTGLFTESGPVPRRSHDPDVRVWSGALRLSGGAGMLTAGGAGWDDDAAEAAGIGEAIERLCPWPLPGDKSIEASVAAWPLDEPPVDPERWVLFHSEQYAVRGFPFRPLARDTLCRWVCFREAGSGQPRWVPEEIAFLSTRPGVCNVLTPAFRRGCRAAGGDPVLLRGLQEVIEPRRTGWSVVGRYPLEEHPRPMSGV
jgi:ribosomal protein S12 methylthiotransferase accessory factor YcaO